MSVTAVPLRPVSKGTLPKLWIGIGVLLIAAIAFAWMTTARATALYGSSDDFLAWNAGQSGVVTTESGLQYRVLEEPQDAEHPGPSDAVLVNYTGRLTDGEEFDQGERVPINLNAVIPGWTEGVQLMGRGGKYRLWVPPALGYGETPPPDSPITADSVMEFDIDLIDYVSQEQLLQMQMQQQMQGQGAPPSAADGQ